MQTVARGGSTVLRVKNILVVLNSRGPSHCPAVSASCLACILLVKYRVSSA